MSVYFATCRELNAVKIGSSLDPHLRMKEVQVGCPFEVTLEAVFSGGPERERQFHRWFADDRLWGEWFKITPEIESLIELNPAPSAPPKPEKQTSPFMAARIAGAAADLERKIQAIRRAEAAGKIPMWVRPGVPA